jgi:hypothetical protein
MTQGFIDCAPSRSSSACLVQTQSAKKRGWLPGDINKRLVLRCEITRSSDYVRACKRLAMFQTGRRRVQARSRTRNSILPLSLLSMSIDVAIALEHRANVDGTLIGRIQKFE